MFFAKYNYVEDIYVMNASDDSLGLTSILKVNLSSTDLFGLNKISEEKEHTS